MSQSNSATNLIVQSTLWGRSRTKEKEEFSIASGSMETLLALES